MIQYVKRDDVLACRQPIGAYGMDISSEDIKAIPAADVVEVRRGRWIIDRAFGNDVLSGEQMVICSVCHKGIFWGKQNYCPNCGAKMDGVNGD